MTDVQPPLCLKTIKCDCLECMPICPTCNENTHFGHLGKSHRVTRNQAYAQVWTPWEDRLSNRHREA